MNTSNSLWTRNFVLVMLANLLVFISHFFLVSTLPLYITNTLKWNQNIVGYVIGIFSIISVVTRPLSGFALDRIGRKKIVFIALIMFIICLSMYNFATTFISLIILRVLHGFFWGFTSTGLGTIAADLVPTDKRGEGLGYYGLSTTLAMAFGPSIALIIIKNNSFSKLFNVSFIFSIIGLVFLVLINYKENITPKSKSKQKISINSFIEKRVLWVSSIMLFVAMSLGAIFTFIVIYGQKIGVRNPGSFYLLYSLILLFIRPFAGKSFDKNGPTKIMFTGLTFGIITFLLLFSAKGWILFYLASITMGVTHGICIPSLTAMAITSVDDSSRGSANATILSAQDLGIGMGSIIFGSLSNVIGLANIYLLCAFLLIIPLMIFYFKTIAKPLGMATE